jgi:hypothetical protein
MTRYSTGLVFALALMGCHRTGSAGGHGGAGVSTGSGGTIAGTTGMGGTSSIGQATGGVSNVGGATETGGAGGVAPGSSLDAGGAVGTGGTAGTPASGGTNGSGGAAGSSLLGTGGSTSPICDPACPSSTTCCDGSEESCDGTRLPSGEGTNTGQFVVSADGLTVTDTITGLVWQRDGSGTRTGCGGSDNLTCTWAQSKAYCASLTLSGISGWRLPAVMELRTILDLTVMDFTGGKAAIDAAAFPNTLSDCFWTSSPYAGSASIAWVVDFFEGLSNYDAVGKNYGVRCVR